MLYARIDLVDDKVKQETVTNRKMVYHVQEEDKVVHHLQS